MLRQVTRVLNKKLKEVFNPKSKMHVNSSSVVKEKGPEKLDSVDTVYGMLPES